MKVQNEEEEYPYMYCEDCSKLSPLVVLKGHRNCGVCGRIGLQEDGQFVVMFSKKEARLRKLPLHKE